MVAHARMAIGTGTMGGAERALGRGLAGRAFAKALAKILAKVLA